MKLEDDKSNQKFAEHLSNHTFKFDKYEYKFEQLYNFFKEGNSPNDDFNLEISCDKKICSLFKIKSDKNVLYFYNHLFNLELYNLKDNKKEIKEVCSTYEIQEIIKGKDSNFYYENQKIINYNISPLMINNNKITLYYYPEVLKKIDFEDKYIYKVTKDKSFDPKIFDNNFYSYFPELDVTQNQNTTIQYIKTKKREDLKFFINQYLNNNKIIKLTGPSGIGKSFFLLYLSRTTHNYLYLNLSALNNLANENQNVKLINMIITELNRLKLSEENKKDLNNYFEGLNLVDLDDIIQFLIDYFINQKEDIRIILDQFKTKYFKSWEKLENLVNNSKVEIKLIICSSINDHNIRDSVCRCINNFIQKEKNNINLDKESKVISKIISSEYFYISSLFDKESLNQLYSSENNIQIKKQNKIIYESFDYNPKYVLDINKADKIGEKIDEIKDKIKQKFQGFYGLDKDDVSLKLKLSSLRRYIGKQLPIKDFNNIISNFSLKYFIIKFYINEEEVDFLKGEMPVNKFQIDYSFIFISEIIDEMALESNDSFFDNGIYKGHTGSTIGGYFELITIDKIKKKILALPNNNFEYIINVDKINEMNKIKLRMSDLIDNNLQILKEMEENISLENNLLNNNENINTEKSINPLGKEDDKKEDIENLFDYKIHPPFEESARINFEANYLIQNSTINEMKNSFIKENNARVYGEKGQLLLSTRLFETTTKKDKITKLKPEIINSDINYHFLKDKNILITQFYENAAAFDLAYLYGKGEKKIFIGFQMKSYKDYYDNNRTFPISREKILKQTQLLLFNSKILLDVDIVQLNYIVVGLYFKDENNLEDKSYSENLIHFCEKNKFKLVLYDPFEKKFLDEKKNFIDEIKVPDKYMNLFEEEEIKPFEENNDSKNIDFLQRKTNRQLEDDLIELTKKTKNLIDNEQKISLNPIITFIDQIKKEFQLNKLRYAGSCRLVNSYKLRVPKEGYLFLFYKNNHYEMEGLNKFYAFIQNNKEFFAYDFQTKTELRYDHVFFFFNLFDINEKYFIFKMEK